MFWTFFMSLKRDFVQSAWAVEYTDCTSAEGYFPRPALPSLPGPLWLVVVAPNRAQSMGQIELNYVLMVN